MTMILKAQRVWVSDLIVYGTLYILSLSPWERYYIFSPPIDHSLSPFIIPSLSLFPHFILFLNTAFLLLLLFLHDNKIFFPSQQDVSSILFSFLNILFFLPIKKTLPRSLHLLKHLLLPPELCLFVSLLLIFFSFLFIHWSFSPLPGVPSSIHFISYSPPQAYNQTMYNYHSSVFWTL